MTKLSIIIPAFNEDKTIAQVLDNILAINIDKEIIVVNDASRDNTLEILERYESKGHIKLISYTLNKGKGYAVKTGFNHATGEILVIFDADLEYYINDVVMMFNHIKAEEHIKVLYGSRYLNKNDKTILARVYGGSYYLAYLGGLVITMTTNILYGTRLTDTTTCLKMFRKEVIDSINITGERFNFEPEINAKVSTLGHTISEIPVSYNPRTREEGKHITYKDGFQALWTLIKYRFMR